MNIRLKPLTVLLVVLVSISLAGCFNLNIGAITPLEERMIGGKGKANKILVIDISGIINNKESTGPLELVKKPRLTSRIKEELDKAEKDSRVKAVLLKINSSGGLVTTTDIIYEEIRRFKERTGKLVVAELMDIAASGGYYIALSADKIIAHPTTVTGSIGVVAFRVNASGLIEKIGITNETIKSGDKKDMGSPLRPSTAEEREIMQAIIDDLFERFKGLVEEERGFQEEDPARLNAVIDGRVFTASQALELGLIDEIGYMDDAIDGIKETLSIDQARVIRYTRGGDYAGNIYSTAAAAKAMGSGINLININGEGLEGLGFRFMYMWLP